MKKLETIDAVIEDILKQPVDEIQRIARGHSEAEFINLCHFSIGTKIRNDYGLWDGNESLLKECRAASPDEASSVILQRLWRTLRCCD